MTSMPPAGAATLGPRFAEALHYALELHSRQRRKGSNAPYFSHLMSVSSLAMQYGGDEDTCIAALLHDAVEDQGGAPVLEQIRTRFGERVAQIVADCTEEQYHERGRKWRERKDAFLARVPGVSAEARLVIAADKLHNTLSYIRDFHMQGPSIWNRFKDGHRGVSWFLRAATEALRRGEDMPILRELDRAVAELEKLEA